MSELLEPIDNLVVVKVGTTTMFRHESGIETLDHDSMREIGRQVIELNKQGIHVPLVSSGAVTAGMEATGTILRPNGEEEMPEVQALAMMGWHHTLNAWDRSMPGVNIGGLLVTRRELDLATPEHDQALRNTYTFLRKGWQIILNENDGITHGELSNQSFGQNDVLSAIYAAQLAKSTLFGNKVRLVLLSDVDGVYEDINDPDSLIKNIDDIDKYEHVAGDTKGTLGKGGMKTKFEAAKIALAAGVEMYVANGKIDNVVQLALKGEAGTRFAA